MKILLLKDVPRVGNKGQIIEVSDAYGMNAFVNKGVAKIANAGDAKAIEKKEKEKKEKKEQEIDKSIEIFKRLEKDVFIFNKKVDNKNHFYAKLSKLEIVDAIFEKEKISISEKQIEMPEIVTPGTYDVKVTVNNKSYKLIVKADK
jgi:large subunit ribosomal protein L9